MFNRKPKKEEQFTPSDLEKLRKKEDKELRKGMSIFKRFSARRSAAALAAQRLLADACSCTYDAYNVDYINVNLTVRRPCYKP